MKLYPPEPAIHETLIREELERILSSRDFHASKLCQNFLRYVVESVLTGQPTNLKERTIGIEVFGKPTSYDPSDDAGVRVKAGEVRKRLRSYYLSRPAEAKVLIELPSGTYIPEFHLLDLNHAEQSVPSKPRSPLWRYLVSAGLIVLVLAVSLFLWIKGHRSTGPLEQFWSPVFQSHNPVFVCVAPVPVYSYIRNADAGGQRKVEDFIAVPNQFVSISDIKASIGIDEMFGRMDEPYKLRLGKEVSFSDLRTGPAVLIGFSYTQWHEIGEKLRYSINMARRPFGISHDGVLTNWTISTHPDDPDLHEDYAIVSRFFYPGTNNMIVEISGISHYGTEAAADLVTNPTFLQQALRRLPPGWQRKNVQIVLHVDVISGSPSVPTVVATDTW